MQISTNGKKNKHFILTQKKLERAKKILGVATETEAVELALDRLITEADQNRKAWAAHDKFMKALEKGDVKILDVYGKLED